MSDIDKIVKGITLKYKTNSPYELASLTGIEIHRNELGRIHGFYYKAYRIKQIYLNSNLDKHRERFVLAHELGHSFLHPDANTPFLKANTYMSVNKMETEANSFAIHLLISDEALLEYKAYSLEQISRIFGYHEKLIQLRMHRAMSEGVEYDT